MIVYRPSNRKIIFTKQLISEIVNGIVLSRPVMNKGNIREFPAKFFKEQCISAINDNPMT